MCFSTVGSLVYLDGRVLRSDKWTAYNASLSVMATSINEDHSAPGRPVRLADFPVFQVAFGRLDVLNAKQLFRSCNNQCTNCVYIFLQLTSCPQHPVLPLPESLCSRIIWCFLISISESARNENNTKITACVIQRFEASLRLVEVDRVGVRTSGRLPALFVAINSDSLGFRRWLVLDCACIRLGNHVEVSRARSREQ